MEGPSVHQHSVQIIARSFQLNGQLEAVGNLPTFLADPSRDALVLTQARVSSLAPGGPVRNVALPKASIRKQEVMFLHFAEQESKEQIRLLARKEPFIAYTPLAVLRGMFHLTAEARLEDFLSTMAGLFIPATDVKLFMLQEMTLPFPKECDLLLVGREHIQFFHQAS